MPVAALTTLIADAAGKFAAGDRAGSLAAYRDAVKIAPGRAELWHNLGALCAAQDARDEALAALAEAARLRPDWAEPWHSRGHVLHAASDFEGARAAFKAALARDGEHLAAHVNLALTLNKLQRYSLALPHLFKARELAPADETIWWMLRASLLRLGRHEDALADFLRFEPHPARAARAVPALWAARRMGDAQREERAVAEAMSYPYRRGDSELVAEAVGLIQYHDVSRKSLLELYRTYDRVVRAELEAAGDALPLAPVTPRKITGDDRRIRIGYLSADFRQHVMGEILEPVLAAHDRSRFEIRLYSIAPAANEDALTQRARMGADDFVRLADDDDSAAARKIAADDLDLLVDLMAHSAYSRPGIAARKPARIIATHLGCHSALGLASVDYKITDGIADTPDNAAFQLERLLPLSTCVLPLRAFREPVARTSRAELGIAPDATVCATFVAAQKLSPRCLALWREFLAAVPNAVLLFSPQRDDDRIALGRRLEGFGIAPRRVHFIAYDSPSLHDRYALADLALDTLPYSGGDTTVAALSAGVPVVTCMGFRHAERISASILAHAGLNELVADSDCRYVEVAIRLASDRAFRSEQREAIRIALARPELTDPAVYARALESAYIRALTEKQLLPY